MDSIIQHIILTEGGRHKDTGLYNPTYSSPNNNMNVTSTENLESIIPHRHLLIIILTEDDLHRETELYIPTPTSNNN